MTIKELIHELKNWLIIKLGGIPWEALTMVEMQNIVNRQMNEFIDNTVRSKFPPTP